MSSGQNVLNDAINTSFFSKELKESNETLLNNPKKLSGSKKARWPMSSLKKTDDGTSATEWPKDNLKEE